jgi:hypothetical protein
MMKRDTVGLVGGIVLIAVGICLVLQNLGIIALGGFLAPVLFGLGGMAFVYTFLANRENWWALIPGLTLLGLAGVVAWDSFGPPAARGWSASFLLGGLGLSFLVIFLNDREHWWAVIPGGALLTIALVAGLSSTGSELIDIGSVFFLGLALTFGLLGVSPTPQGRQKWALIPAAALLAVGILTMAAMADVLRYAWPVALIVAGAWAMFRTLVSKDSQ